MLAARRWQAIVSPRSLPTTAPQRSSANQDALDLPHITVTIPAYNHGKFIARAIESVLVQEHRDIDVIVVNDASTDDTLEVARHYESDTRLHCVSNEQNLGLARNWNRCLALANGPLVMVFGSDDELDPDYLSRVSTLFTAHPEAGLVYAPVRGIDAKGRILNPGSPRKQKLYAAGDAAVSALLETGIGTVTTVFRRDACAAVGDYDESIADGPDVVLCARIAQRYDVIDAGAVGGSFRVHDRKIGPESYLRAERLESYMRGTRQIYDCLSRVGLRDRGIADLDRFIANDGARFALNGALTTIAYGKPEGARLYLRHVVRLDPGWWRSRRFWWVLALLAVPPLGTRIMRHRMKFDV